MTEPNQYPPPFSLAADVEQGDCHAAGCDRPAVRLQAFFCYSHGGQQKPTAKRTNGVSGAVQMLGRNNDLRKCIRLCGQVVATLQEGPTPTDSERAVSLALLAKAEDKVSKVRSCLEVGR